jgi:heterogeneous nuclear ribonucleoprotein A1/A3
MFEEDDDIYSSLKNVTSTVYTTNRTPSSTKSSTFDQTPGAAATSASSGAMVPKTNGSMTNGNGNNRQQEANTSHSTNSHGGIVTDVSTHTEEYIATICRAWKLGKCERGESCRFTHDQAYYNTEKWVPPNAKAKIFVGGVPFEASEDDIRLGFEKYGEIQDISIVKDKITSKSRGFGFVTFVDETVIDTVLVSDNFVLERKVDLRRAVPRGQEAPPPPNRRTFKDTEGAANGGGGGGGGHRRAESAEDWRKKVFVGGVPQDIDNEAVKQYFSKYCKNPEARLMYDRNTGRNRGFGFVVFPSSEIVEQVLLDRHMLGGKAVEIKRAVPRGQMAQQQPNRSNAGRGGRHQQGGGAAGGGMYAGGYQGSGGGGGYSGGQGGGYNQNGGQPLFHRGGGGGVQKR